MEAKKHSKRSAVAAAIAAIASVGLTKGASAQEAPAEDGYVNLSGLDSVVEVRQLEDGSIELLLESGQVVQISVDDVVVNNNQIFVLEAVASQIANLGASFEGTSPILLGTLALVGLGVGLGVGLSGDDNEPTPEDDILLGTELADNISGLAGNDTINGLEGDDILSGDAGDDILDGGTGNDTLNGGAGLDTLIGGAGDDTIISDLQDNIDGGTGNDTADFSNASGPVFVDLDVDSAGGNGTPGQQGAVLDAAPNAGGQQLFDLDDIENVIGSSGDDVIFGNNEVNNLSGGAGDDVFHSFGGADFVDGGTGNDTVLFSAGPGVTVDLDEDGNAVASVGDTLTSIENISGSNSGDDDISGNSGDNILNGQGGNDILRGEGGNDTINGGTGDDFIAGGGGTDVLDGGEGNDTNSFEGIGAGVTASLADGTASYGQVNETFTNFENLDGSANDDNLTGDDGVNILTGNAGDDVLTGGLGSDVIDGGDGFDTADFSDIDVPVEVIIDANGNGTATRETGFGIDFSDAPVVVAGALNPELSGDFVTEALAGNLYFNIHTNDFGAGEIRGQLDTIVSDETVDGVRTIVLSASLDAAQEPGPTSDSEATGTGLVTITVAADGTITYSVDLDVTGLATSDLLPVAGFSAIHLHNAPAGVNGPVVLDVVQDAGGDIFGNTAEGDVFAEVVETDTLVSIENIIGSDDGDVIITSGPVSNSIEAGAGDDFVQAGGGSDFTDGGEGIDTVSFADIGVGVTVDLGAEADQAQYIVGENTVIDQVVNFENVIGSSNDDVITGDDGDNVLTGGLGSDVIDGGDGFDTADFSDIDVPVIVTLDEDGNGTAVRETGFGVEFEDVAIDPAALLENATLNPELSGDFLTEALAGNLYFNIHTSDFGAGEIRGQIDTIVSDETDEAGVRTIVLTAELDASQEPGPTSDSEATGTATVTITVAADGSLSYSVDLDVTGLATSDLMPVAGFSAIHIHNAPAGVNGPVVLDIVQDAGGDIFGDTAEGDVFDEVVETDTLISIEEVILSDDNDTLVGAAQADGGEGIDTVLLTATPVGTVLDLDDNGDGTVFINGNASDTVVNFENISGSNAGDDILSGNSSANVLNGNGGNDMLDGEGGADVINGGLGDDTLTGGLDSDTFVIAQNSGDDTVTDFEDGIDLIDVQDFGPDFDLDAVLAAAVQDGPNTVLTLDANTTLTLENTQLADLDATDFVLAEPEASAGVMTDMSSTDGEAEGSTFTPMSEDASEELVDAPVALDVFESARLPEDDLTIVNGPVVETVSPFEIG